MSEKININNNDNEELSLPKEVYNANWRDDVVEEVKKENEAIDFEPFEDEQGYESRETIEPEAEYLIGAFERAKLKNFGSKTLRVYGKAA